MHILLFILIFIIAIFVFGLSIVGFILRTIFGLGRGSSSSRPKQTESGRTSQQDYGQRDRRSNDDEEEIYSENFPEKRHKKIFTQDDGEYVDLRKSNKTGYCFYFRFAAKNSFISVAHSSAITPFTTTVLGCRAEPAYF